jgi:DNA polymerase-3 subunit epsilon
LREIVLDTETTGLDPFAGHRLVEIGCVELVNRMPSGQHFHRYVNPDRDMPADAFAVHGLSAEFLNDKPRFTEIAEELLAFLGDAPLVAHNAAFDLGFLNAELERAGKASVGRERLVDTLLLARRKHPAGPNRLDDLCARYSIDNSRRTKHGALLDAEILAEVYLELIGARQAQLILVEAGSANGMRAAVASLRVRPHALAPRLSTHESEAHVAFVATLGESAIWQEYLRHEPYDRSAGQAFSP